MSGLREELMAAKEKLPGTNGFSRSHHTTYFVLISGIFQSCTNILHDAWLHVLLLVLMFTMTIWPRKYLCRGRKTKLGY